ncbi:hypothetical protein [Elizabethkingia anophelis]|uniref:hypothetical protein n=1 Tax=Elizabethkingia anophelis TaxID=1117645 RepID=UPI0021A8688A|nr:hypothetical protein [Elizabethkingia anophelis]
MDDTMLLSPFFDDLEINLSSDIFRFNNKNKEVAHFGDFLSGFTDSCKVGEPITHNSYLSINKKYLSNFLKKKKLVLAFVIKQSIIVKDIMDRHDQYKNTDIYEIFLPDEL